MSLNILNPGSNAVRYTTTLSPAAHWSLVVRRGISLTMTDLEGGANVGLLMYNPNLLAEKYNAPDTLKCQHTFKLTRGNCLYSDMGRIFCSIVEDTFGWHDTVCGNSDADIVRQRWGGRDYQGDRNLWQQNGRDSFLVELVKYGLSRRDMPANVNFFSRVETDQQGNLQLGRRAAAGDRVTLRFEMDALVILHSCPHPLSREKTYPRRPVKLELSESREIRADDPCLNHCDENRRGFENNALYHLGLGAAGIRAEEPSVAGT
ncbi:urea amidolyase associated protein UAAP1 [Microbulbifer sp.]|uniref:urea amidolyase associated protein UAAP1 n=1 Tax=Microbulbifer sp. TaxID=1908541 RepID=UPI003F3B25EE